MNKTFGWCTADVIQIVKTLESFPADELVFLSRDELSEGYDLARLIPYFHI